MLNYRLEFTRNYSPMFGIFCIFALDLCKQNYHSHINNTLPLNGERFPRVNEGFPPDPQVDLCEPNPCFEPRYCLDKGNNYTCECPKGFSGVDCLLPTRAVSNHFRSRTTNIRSNSNMLINLKIWITPWTVFLWLRIKKKVKFQDVRRAPICELIYYRRDSDGGVETPGIKSAIYPRAHFKLKRERSEKMRKLLFKASRCNQWQGVFTNFEIKPLTVLHSLRALRTPRVEINQKLFGWKISR